MSKILILLLFILSPAFLEAQQLDRKQLIADLKYLSSDELAGRAPLSPGSKKAQSYITERFSSLELSSQFSDYTQYFSFGEEEKVENAANIVAFIPGEESEKIIVITAHYDHLGVKEGKIYNGTDDNASGTAALLALATYFSHKAPKHSMVFAALDAEERGLQGAKALVKDFPFSLDQVLLNINMDMISRNDHNEIYAAGTRHYPELKVVLENASEGERVSLKFGHDLPNTGHDDWTNASDHAAFHAKGIPFVYFGVEDHADYHKDTDTFEKVNQDFYFNTVKLIIRCAEELDANLPL
ncbi:M28 family peptidase [Echinicola marina]|uniref:M28 family peptidase n=1 Tax=Echinicola marina TaxID=2859768 RepID=UPI001CF70220|nr:M28 family peptidase [Echinicola marina]UCS94687.1 M28 family peptidase [Echinicola marina]